MPRLPSFHQGSQMKASLRAGCVWVVVSLLSPFAVAQTVSRDPATRALDPLIRDMCDREVVLLGEDANHGAGRTIEVKTLIISRLVDECAFGAVVFESQFYDFLEHERLLPAGKATRQDLADAIGALWSRSREMQPLIDLVHARLASGNLRVAGMDPQVGGVTGYFSQQRLGRELAGPLEEPRRTACEAELSRHHSWKYDAVNAFDDAAKGRLRACGAEIEERAARSVAPVSVDAAIARSYSRYLAMALDDDPDARDLGMFENLMWHRARWPKGVKLIVWTATSHASSATTAALPGRPLGARVREALGDRSASIGFTALSGTFRTPGSRGKVMALPAAESGSLEARVGPTDNAPIGYLGKTQLREAGVVPGRALNYAKPQAVDWSTVLDGLVVLREERAVEAVPETPPVKPSLVPQRLHRIQAGGADRRDQRRDD